MPQYLAARDTCDRLFAMPASALVFTGYHGTVRYGLSPQSAWYANLFSGERQIFHPGPSSDELIVGGVCLPQKEARMRAGCASKVWLHARLSHGEEAAMIE